MMHLCGVRKSKFGGIGEVLDVSRCIYLETSIVQKGEKEGKGERSTFAFCTLDLVTYRRIDLRVVHSIFLNSQKVSRDIHSSPVFRSWRVTERAYIYKSNRDIIYIIYSQIFTHSNLIISLSCAILHVSISLVRLSKVVDYFARYLLRHRVIVSVKRARRDYDHVLRFLVISHLKSYYYYYDYYYYYYYYRYINRTRAQDLLNTNYRNVIYNLS